MVGGHCSTRKATKPCCQLQRLQGACVRCRCTLPQQFRLRITLTCHVRWHLPNSEPIQVLSISQFKCLSRSRGQPASVPKGKHQTHANSFVNSRSIHPATAIYSGCSQQCIHATWQHQERSACSCCCARPQRYSHKQYRTSERQRCSAAVD
jgi:hypothetical protein